MTAETETTNRRTERLESKIDQLGEVLVELRVQGEERKGKLESIGCALNDHISEERDRLNRLDARVSILEQAKQQAAGAKSFVEWIVRYGWAVLAAAVTAFWYANKGGQ